MTSTISNPPADDGIYSFSSPELNLSSLEAMIIRPVISYILTFTPVSSQSLPSGRMNTLPVAEYIRRELPVTSVFVAGVTGAAFITGDIVRVKRSVKVPAAEVNEYPADEARSTFLPAVRSVSITL